MALWHHFDWQLYPRAPAAEDSASVRFRKEAVLSMVKAAVHKAMRRPDVQKLKAVERTLRKVLPCAQREPAHADSDSEVEGDGARCV